jgi:pimeloyl-ACP methyl ester carboxylesterase
VTLELGVQRFHLAGNSMGGRTAWIYALDHPRRLDRLILIDASGHPDEDGEEEGLGFRLARMPIVGRVMHFVTPRSVIEKTLQAAFADPALVTDAMVTRYHELLLREGSREASAARFRLPVETAKKTDWCPSRTRTSSCGRSRTAASASTPMWATFRWRSPRCAPPRTSGPS